MAEAKKINTWLKLALELGPVVLFFVAYGRLKDQTFSIAGTEYGGFILVTACFIPLLLLSTGILWKLTGNLSRMQVVTAVLVIVFGGLSVWFNDERFFKMKPTIIYLFFGGTLAIGLLQGRSYLQYVMEEAMPLKSEGWMILTKRLALFFFVLAILNEVVWRGFSTDTWVTFKTFGLSAAVFLFFMTQSKLFSQFGVEQKED
ncbi:MAG: septation protein IspZ [Paracoccaceae bacterium]|nr:septation protein IspZ [Paracoccaceae bacterium]MDG2259395.1 septation protein IspZ [Paracoccaceae bacterium]